MNSVVFSAMVKRLNCGDYMGTVQGPYKRANRLGVQSFDHGSYL